LKDGKERRFPGSLTEREMTEQSNSSPRTGYTFRPRPMMGRTSEEVRLELERRREEKQRSKTTLKTRHKSSLESLLESSSFMKKTSHDHVTSKVHAAMHENKKAKVGLTLKKLQNWDPKLNKLLDRNFNPTKLFGDNDSEDDHYLAEYQLPQKDDSKKPIYERSPNRNLQKNQEIQPQQQQQQPPPQQQPKVLAAVKVPMYLRKYSDIHDQRSRDKSGLPMYSHRSQREMVSCSGSKYFHEEYAKESSRSNYIEPVIPEYVTHHVQNAIYSDSRRSMGRIDTREDQGISSPIGEREVEETITTVEPPPREEMDMIEERKVPQKSARRREPSPNMGKKTNEGNVIRFSDFMKQRGMGVHS